MQVFHTNCWRASKILKGKFFGRPFSSFSFSSASSPLYMSETLFQPRRLGVFELSIAFQHATQSCDGENGQRSWTSAQCMHSPCLSWIILGMWMERRRLCWFDDGSAQSVHPGAQAEAGAGEGRGRSKNQDQARIGQRNVADNGGGERRQAAKRVSHFLIW